MLEQHPVSELPKGAQLETLHRLLSKEKGEKERQLSLLLRNSPDIIILLNERGRFVFATQALLRALGVEQLDALQSRTFPQVFSNYLPPERIDYLKERLREVARNRTDFQFSQAIDFQGDGSLSIYEVRFIPVTNAQDIAEGMLIIFHDETALAQARDRAEQASRAKSDFLLTISHEIRTPLHAILGIAGMLKKTPLDEAQQSLLGNLENASQALLGLIEDILDYAKIVTGKQQVEEGYFSLPDMLRKLRDVYAALFAQKSLSFHCRWDAALPPVVLGDEKKIAQILSNLLHNAWKFTQAGEVVFGAAPYAEGICFCISDTGIGIPPEKLDKLYLPFEPLDDVRHKTTPGTSLGLPIARQLCEMMQGEIQVQSEVGKGSTFTVKLPLPVGTASDLPDAKAQLAAFHAPTARVLLVDDIELNLMVAEAMLEAYQLQITCASGGREALSLLRQEAFDLVLLDHMMPEMDGMETVRHIRQLPGANAHIPVVAFTANVVEGAREIFLQGGFQDFLTKPIDAAQLSACLLRWLPKEKVELE